MQGIAIVDRNLFARLNVTQGEEDQVAVKQSRVAVGRTRVVHVMSAVAAATTIETPLIVDAANSQDATGSSPFRFSVGDSLPAVLGDSFPASKPNCRKTSSPMNW